jgi:hypothetical protein
MIFDKDVENQDFLELIIHEKELQDLDELGISEDFDRGVDGRTPLNILIRIEKGACDAVGKGKKSKRH